MCPPRVKYMRKATTKRKKTCKGRRRKRSTKSMVLGQTKMPEAFLKAQKDLMNKIAPNRWY